MAFVDSAGKILKFLVVPCRLLPNVSDVKFSSFMCDTAMTSGADV